MALSILVGATVGAVGAGVLWGLLPRVQRLAPRQVAAATLALSVAALVAADLIREDTGFLATLLMGMFLANQRSIDVAQAVEFHETLVQLLIGVLFVMIAASVSPSDISHVLGGALVLVAIMVLLIRPAVVALSTWRSELDPRERAFVGLDGAARDRRRIDCLSFRSAARRRTHPGGGQDSADCVRRDLRDSRDLWPERGECRPAARDSRCAGDDGVNRRRPRGGSCDRRRAQGGRCRRTTVGRTVNAAGRASGRAECRSRADPGRLHQPRSGARGGHRCGAPFAQR